MTFFFLVFVFFPFLYDIPLHIFVLFSWTVPFQWGQCVKLLYSVLSFFLFIMYFSIYSPFSLSLHFLYAVLLSGTLDAQPNRILLVTVHHMLYPMTVDVLYQVFSPHGSVEKIVTFQKSAGQILSDFSLSLLSIPINIFVFLDFN